MVLDSSAVLAYLRRETGWEIVQRELGPTATLSIINLAEVLTKLADFGVDPITAMAELEHDAIVQWRPGGALIEVIPASRDIIVRAAVLRGLTRTAGLSLGDRVCLATAQTLGLPVLTGDRSWTTLSGLSVPIRLIR